jgi:hypothetical protein
VTLESLLGAPAALRANKLLARACVLAAFALLASLPIHRESLGSRFFKSLRIARPQTVTANAPAPGAARRLSDVVIGIAAETTTVSTVEEDRPVPSADSASRLAGMHVRLLTARSDPASFVVLGAETTGARANRRQLTTLLAEAGRRELRVDPSIDGAPLSLAVPRGVRVQLGNCPPPIQNTLQSQIQGPPPPSMDNGNCVILTEVPQAASATPAGLDTSAVLGIAVELMGMSPNQARDFQRLFGWRGALAMSPPRFVRSYEVVDVGDQPGMLMITGGRRGPTYVLSWMADGVVYTLTGYGSSADAVALARSAG